MREIKFRAWDSMLEKTLTWDELKASGMSLFVILETQNLIKPMQYTGLTDKNGTEIYEGDVVDTLDGIGKVIYEDLLCAFAIEYKASKIAFIHYVTQENATLEVIGNIYENKELLA